MVPLDIPSATNGRRNINHALAMDNNRIGLKPYGGIYWYEVAFRLSYAPRHDRVQTRLEDFRVDGANRQDSHFISEQFTPALGNPGPGRGVPRGRTPS